MRIARNHIAGLMALMSVCLLAPQAQAFQLFSRASKDVASSHADGATTSDVDKTLKSVSGLMNDALDNLRKLEQSFFSMVPAVDVPHDEKHDADSLALARVPLHQIFSRMMSRSAMDVVETNREITFTADVPGIDASSLHVDVVTPSNILVIRGERDESKECPSAKNGARGADADVVSRRIERHSGRFVNKYALPQEADLEKVTAEVKNGVLRVRVPKHDTSEQSRVVSVPIATSAS